VGFFSDLKTRRAIADLTERLETIERTLKATRLEWEDTYDRLRRLMGRVAKRALRDESAVDPEHVEPTADDSRGADGAMTATHSLLTPRQRQFQQEILRRRGGG
jgi:hypothetical protein